MHGGIGPQPDRWHNLPARCPGLGFRYASIDDIAAEFVERAAALDPCYATYAGIAGHDHELGGSRC